MADLFTSAKSTHRHAIHRIGEFEAKITAFERDRDWSYVIEKNADGTKESHKIKFKKIFFDETPNIVFDAVNNLRAVLDQTAYAAAVASGKLNPKCAYFPIGDDAAGLENVIKGRCKDIPREIVALFRTFKPYKRGNLFIPTLNKLCNAKKHAILIPIRFDRLGVAVQIGGAIFGLPHEWDPEKCEITLLHVGRGTDFSRGGKFAFKINFNHDEPVIGGSEPLALLNGMAREVERILIATEAECRRLRFVS